MMDEFKKILIKAPNKKSEAAATYPFIQILKEEYPNSQIQILVREGHENLYKIFPFEVLAYVVDEDELSLPGIHKYAVNQHDIFNIDIFFDLCGSFKSCFLGFSFRAKERVGYVSGLNKILLTHRVESFISYRPDKIHLRLLESFLEKDFSDSKVSGIETAEQLKSKNLQELSNLPPYFFIHANDLLSQPLFWNDFFRFFENQYFVVWFDPAWGEEEYDNYSKYLKSLEQKNIYMLKTGPDELFIKLLIHSIGYLSNNLETTYLASYLGIKTYAFLKKATDLPFMEHFLLAPVLIEMLEAIPVKWIGSDETKPIETVDRLVNILHDIHEL